MIATRNCSTAIREIACSLNGMGESLNLVFCGTPAFAAPTLEKLSGSGFGILLVVTQPDRPKGRGLQPVASAVKQAALKLGLPIEQPEKIKHNFDLRSKLEGIRPAAIVVVGYGRIMPRWMFALPRYGSVNLHASLLPKYRGAAPVQWAIAKGEKVTGVTTMRIDEGLDTGDILLQRELEIAAEDTSETLSPKLATLGADVMIETLRGLQAGTIEAHPQNHGQATQAPVLRKEDGRIDFHRSAGEIHDRLRGFQPWPGAFTVFRGKDLKLIRAQPAEFDAPVAELLVQNHRLFVGCGHNTALELLELQPEGKRPIKSRDFIHGYHPQVGEPLGP